jgi:hypothetical protein
MTLQGRLVADFDALAKPGDYCFPYDRTMGFACPGCGLSHAVSISPSGDLGWSWNVWRAA